jgi:hypothetical protein
MLKMAVNVALFGAYLLMVLVFGFFLWQTLFASKEYGSREAQSKPAYSEQRSSSENALGSGLAPSPTKSTDEAIADYTKWLAIFTMFLVLVSVGLFISGERNVGVARESAHAAEKAANIAEKSLTELERPYIFVQIPKFVPNTIPNRPDRVQYVLKNYGRTPAIVRWFKAEAKRQVANEGGWSNFFNGQIILASGEEREFEVVGGGGMNPYPKSDPLSADPNQTALLNIEVTYSDVFDYFHVSGFSFFERGGTFYAIGGNQYNRRKSAKLPPGTEWTPAWSDEP